MPPPGVCLDIIKEQHRKEGYGTPENPVKFLNQDFQTLQQNCLAQGTKYVDAMFPPDSNAIGQGLLTPEEMQQVKWARPTELVKDPYLVVDSVSRFDFAQGRLGDCWFLASVGALTFQPHMLKQLLPLDQSFKQDYAGIFHFRFWRFGQWYDVVIDDKLPVLDGKLIFVHHKTDNEFWPALLEKAYAKVCGSYADMKSGAISEALIDFTGGIHMMFELKDAPSDLFEVMQRAAKSNSLMGCGTPDKMNVVRTSLFQCLSQPTSPDVLPNGIVAGHAYAVTDVTRVTSRGKPIKLVRLWNPWGKGEWKGDWSDQSDSWKTVSSEDKTRCLKIDDNGEFWMCMEDWRQRFDSVDICCLCPDFLDDSPSGHWVSSFHEGRWVAGTTAGGHPYNKDTFWTNPQYRVRLDKPEKEDHQGKNNMLISLMQKPKERNRHLVSNFYIGFSVFEVPPHMQKQRGKFPASFFNHTKPVSKTKAHINSREVMKLSCLKPGEYLIVPSTYKPNEAASFILAILSKNRTHIVENSSVDRIEINKLDGFKEEDMIKSDKLFRKYTDQYEEVNAEQLQRLLNDGILRGLSPKTGGFSLDACRGIIAIMDLSITGTLHGQEFNRLWKRVVNYKKIFLEKNVSRTGKLSLKELRNTVEASGVKVSDDMLNLLALRYGGSSGHITLSSFICLILRLDAMAKIFQKLSDGQQMCLQEREWMFLSMYS